MAAGPAGYGAGFPLHGPAPVNPVFGNVTATVVDGTTVTGKYFNPTQNCVSCCDTIPGQTPLPGNATTVLKAFIPMTNNPLARNVSPFGNFQVTIFVLNANSTLNFMAKYEVLTALDGNNPVPVVVITPTVTSVGGIPVGYNLLVTPTVGYGGVAISLQTPANAPDGFVKWCAMLTRSTQ